MSTRALIPAFVRLRWRLLLGSIRHGGAEQVGAILATVGSALVGLGGATAIAIGARTSGRPAELAVIFCTLVVVAMVGLGVVAGIAQPVDPRVIAAEPLSDRVRAVGLLASSAFGPPGLAGILLGVGLATGMAAGLTSLPVVVLAVASWLFTLLLAARTATNLLAVLVSRFPRAGQLIVGLSGLAFYGMFQFVPALLGGLSDDQRTTLANGARWTPPGQIGRALATAGDSVPRSLLHLGLGTLWVPVLWVCFMWSADRLALTVRSGGGLATADHEASRFRRLARRGLRRRPDRCDRLAQPAGEVPEPANGARDGRRSGYRSGRRAGADRAARQPGQRSRVGRRGGAAGGVVHVGQ